jgi:PGF-pre-PGF domain-containing protein
VIFLHIKFERLIYFVVALAYTGIVVLVVSMTAGADVADNATVDDTPPSTVSNLKQSMSGLTWIRWTWVNPDDSDFSHVRIYLDDTFVTTTSSQFYNATGLAPGTAHTIGIETVDTTGNINHSRVIHSATTLKLPVISNVVGKDIKENSITLEWDASENTAVVQITLNGIVLATITEPTFIHNNLNSSTTYNYTLIPFTENGLRGEAVSISLTTSSAGSSGSGRRSSSSSGSSSSGSSGGGGGSAGSVEDFENVFLKDVDSKYLRTNANVTYEFARAGNYIQSVSFYSLKNSGEITSTIEVLNKRSKLASFDPEGIVYKYINIWVGKAGFATTENIKDAHIKFKVNNSWMKEHEIKTQNIKLQRYNGSAWEVLPTVLQSNTTEYSIFEAETPGFSPFAITAMNILSPAMENSSDTTYLNDVGVEKKHPEKSKIWTFIIAFLIIGILVVGYEYLKRE